MAVLGMNLTTNLESSERSKAWRLGISDLYPNAAPLIHVINRIGKENVADVEYNWYEREISSGELTLDAADVPLADVVAGGLDTMKLAAGQAYYLRAGSMILNVTKAETVRVYTTPTNGTNVSIVRGLGLAAGVAVAAWGAADVLQITSPSSPEASTIVEAHYEPPTKYMNYLQIFDHSAKVSGTLNATELRTGRKFQDAQMQALFKHEVAKEWAVLVGVPSEDLTTNPGATRTTGGLLSRVASNVFDHTAGTNYQTFIANLAQTMATGSEERLALAGSGAMLVLEEMARANTIQWVEVSKQDSFGMALRKITTAWGDVMIKEEKILSRNSALKNWMFVVDPQDITYRFAKGRDTEWIELKTREQGIDAVIGHYFAEAGFEIHHEKHHAIFKNVNQFVG